jgi:hypothetical protein
MNEADVMNQNGKADPAAKTGRNKMEVMPVPRLLLNMGGPHDDLHAGTGPL